ncbi:MAG: site-2 protease family protein, partial [Allosphingosinicella sp.]
MGPDNIVFQIATWLIPLVIAIVLHEISHGWVANAFGDPTAREQGRLSLNPVRHVDPVGADHALAHRADLGHGGLAAAVARVDPKFDPAVAAVDRAADHQILDDR